MIANSLSGLRPLIQLGWISAHVKFSILAQVLGKQGITYKAITYLLNSFWDPFLTQDNAEKSL